MKRNIIIKHDKNLIDLAIVLGVDCDQLSEVIIESGIMSNLFRDEKCEFGMTIIQHYEIQGIEYDRALQHLMAKGTVHNDTDQFMLAKKEAEMVLKLTTVGKGECPDCGGECDEIDGDGKWTYRDGRESPPEYIPYWSLMRCFNCEKQFKLYPHHGI